MDFMALANTKLASSLGQGLGEALGGPKGPTISGGGTMDARSFMDGSGWVVATGSAKATGGDRTQGEAWGPSTVNTPQPLQAGMGVGGWLLLLVFAGMVYRSRVAA